LKNLSIQIETAVIKNKTSGFRNQENVDKPFQMGEFIALQNQIKKYKELITETNTRMETIYNFQKIKETENEILKKQEKLEKIKLENQTLCKIERNINKGVSHKNQLNIILDRFRVLKNELKYSKESLKLTESNLKSQTKEIIELEEKNSKIKECIEMRKKNKNVAQENLEELIDKINFLEFHIQSEEKFFKEKLNNQHNLIWNINDEISKIKLRIKGKEQKIKIEELKIKEIRRIKRNEERKTFEMRLVQKGSDNNSYHKLENKVQNQPIIFKTINRIKKPFEIKFSRSSEKNINIPYSNYTPENNFEHISNLGNFYNHENDDDFYKEEEIEVSRKVSENDENFNTNNPTPSTLTDDRENKQIINQINNLSNLNINCSRK